MRKMVGSQMKLNCCNVLDAPYVVERDLATEAKKSRVAVNADALIYSQADLHFRNKIAGKFLLSDDAFWNENSDFCSKRIGTQPDKEGFDNGWGLPIIFEFEQLQELFPHYPLNRESFSNYYDKIKWDYGNQIEKMLTSPKRLSTQSDTVIRTRLPMDISMDICLGSFETPYYGSPYP